MLSQFGIFTVRENNDEAAITWKSQHLYIFLGGIFHASSKWLLDAAEKNVLLNNKIAEIYRNTPNWRYAKDQCCLQFTFFATKWYSHSMIKASAIIEDIIL